MTMTNLVRDTMVLAMGERGGRPDDCEQMQEKSRKVNQAIFLSDYNYKKKTFFLFYGGEVTHGSG